MIGLNLFSAQYGVSHADELFIMFKSHKIPIDGVYTESDKATSKNVLKLWTDFAKTGNPTPDPETTQWTRSDVTF
jgi:carboxylesterase type B